MNTGTVVIIWLFDLQLPVQSVPITTNVASSNPVHGEMYSIRHYMIKFASDLQQDGFLWVLSISSTNKNDRHDIIEIVLIVYVVVWQKMMCLCSSMTDNDVFMS
jgi:hypothetical protein